MEAKYYISTDEAELDLEFVHSYLSEQSYWAKGRSMDLVKRSIDHSLCFGLYENGKQIGFGRVATDHVVFAWLMDLFIDPAYRGQGLGAMLVEHIVNHPSLSEVNGIGLRTDDAHELYARFGFGPIPNTNTWMFRKKN